MKERRRCGAPRGNGDRFIFHSGGVKKRKPDSGEVCSRRLGRLRPPRLAPQRRPRTPQDPKMGGGPARAKIKTKSRRRIETSPQPRLVLEGAWWGGDVSWDKIGDTPRRPRGPAPIHNPSPHSGGNDAESFLPHEAARTVL